MPDRCNHKSNDIDKLKGRYCPGEKSQVSVSGTQCKLFEVGGFTQAVPDSMEDLSSCVILRALWTIWPSIVRTQA